MLDTKRSWDELVLRHAPDEATAYRILDNRMYHNVTSRFVQSHDYIAMERLYEIHAGGDYDLIIIDTPPTRNAIDFLDAPARMAEFFGGRLLRWLTMPYRIGGGRGGRMINVASRPFYQLADRLLGSQFLQDIAEFFLNFQSMYGGFVERAQSVEQLLHDRRTTFAVVTTLEGAPLREAESFCAELTTRNFHLGALVLNKTLPDYLLSADGDRAADRAWCATADLATRWPMHMLAAMDSSWTTGRASTRVLRTLGESFRNYEVVARREAELRVELGRLPQPGPEVVVSVPNFDADIADVAGLIRIGEVLFGRRPRGAPVRSLRDHILRAGAHEDRALGRVAASRPTPGGLVAAARRPLLLRPVAPRAGRGRRRRPLRGARPGAADHRPDRLPDRSRGHGRRRSRSTARGAGVPQGRGDRRRCASCSVRPSGPTCSASRSATPARWWPSSPVRRAPRSVASSVSSSSSTSRRSTGSPRMIAEGSFPFRQDDDEFEDAPRVGDGVVLLDPDLRVRFASPNAVSSMHRLGIHSYTSGLHLSEMGFDQDAVDVAIRARLPVTEEIERGETSLLIQAIPQLEADRVVGVLLLLRDVTDLRRRDRLLLSKDATIREIHHRVKNNLQTIAALLRLQGRRLQSPEAQAAIEESERRIRSIAIVHETLSRDAGEVVRFDDIVQPLVRVVAETVTGPDRDLRLAVEGDAGMLPGDLATPLAVVLNELMQNAVDHAFTGVDARTVGTICVQLARDDGQLVVDVVDDGVGLPPGFSVEQSGGLGTLDRAHAGHERARRNDRAQQRRGHAGAPHGAAAQDRNRDALRTC